LTYCSLEDVCRKKVIQMFNDTHTRSTVPWLMLEMNTLNLYQPDWPKTKSKGNCRKKRSIDQCILFAFYGTGNLEWVPNFARNVLPRVPCTVSWKFPNQDVYGFHPHVPAQSNRHGPRKTRAVLRTWCKDNQIVRNKTLYDEEYKF